MSQETPNVLNVWYEKYGSHTITWSEKEPGTGLKDGEPRYYLVRLLLGLSRALRDIHTAKLQQKALWPKNTFLNDNVSLKLTHVLIIHLLGFLTVFQAAESLLKQNIKRMRSSGWSGGGQDFPQVEPFALDNDHWDSRNSVNQPARAASVSHKWH